MRSLLKTSRRLAGILLVTAPLVIASVFFLTRLPGVVSPVAVNHSWLIFLAYGWTGIFLHEAGHAVAGTLVGFRLSVFRVTPLELVIQNDGRARFAWHPRLGGGYLGLPKHERSLTRRNIMITAGGPAANVLTFGLCWLALHTAAGALSGTGFAFVRGLMMFSFFSAVLNLAPFEFGASKTDGRRLWEAMLPRFARQSRPSEQQLSAEATSSQQLAA